LHSFADGAKVKFPGNRLFSTRTIKCLTNVEAFALRAADLEEVTVLFARFLRNPRVQGAIRYIISYLIILSICTRKYMSIYLKLSYVS